MTTLSLISKSDIHKYQTYLLYANKIKYPVISIKITMNFLSQMFIALTLLCLTHANVNATINLNGYTLDTGPITIAQIPDDLSGLTYNAMTNTLFASINGTPTVYELDTNGNILRTINLTGFEDTEGLVWIGGTDFIIIEERRGRAVRITISPTTTAIAYPTAFMQLPGTWGNNLGLEGVSYNPATNELLIIKEKSPLTLYSFVVPATYNGMVAVTNPFNIATNNFGFTDIAGLHHLGLNTYMPCGVDVGDNYLILSHESAALIETDDTGTEYSRLNLGVGGANGTLATALPQAEGVTMDNQGNIYVVSEPNLFYRFAPAPCCATVDLDIRFDGFPAQTTWNIADAGGNIVASSSSYSGTPANSFLTENTCLPDGCYTLNFSDALGNGMCPFRATASSAGTFITPGTLITPGSVVATLGTVVTPGLCGNYTLYDANGGVLASGGGSFGTSESNSFCLSGGVAQRLPETRNIQLKSAQTSTQIQITPNPVNDNAMLYYSLETNEDVHIQLVDITGKIVQQYKRNFDDANEIQLNVNHLQSGFYFVQLMSGDVMFTEKFVKK